MLINLLIVYIWIDAVMFVLFISALIMVKLKMRPMPRRANGIS